MLSDGFSVSVASLPECELVSVRGELDGATAPELVAAIHRARGAGRPVVIDLSELAFIDSGGVHAMMQPSSRESLTAVVCPQGNVSKVLSIVRIDQLMPVYDRIETALASLR